MTPTATSAKLLEIMLEELEPAAVTMVAGPVAVLASYGTTTGKRQVAIFWLTLANHLDEDRSGPGDR